MPTSNNHEFTSLPSMPVTRHLQLPTARPSVSAFDNTYARLPERFIPGKSNTGSDPAPCEVESVNWPVALSSTRTRLASEQGVQILAGNRVAEGSEPLALAYAGHQFEIIVPQARRRPCQLARGGDGA